MPAKTGFVFPRYNSFAKNRRLALPGGALAVCFGGGHPLQKVGQTDNKTTPAIRQGIAGVVFGNDIVSTSTVFIDGIVQPWIDY